MRTGAPRQSLIVAECGGGGKCSVRGTQRNRCEQRRKRRSGGGVLTRNADQRQTSHKRCPARWRVRLVPSDPDGAGSICCSRMKRKSRCTCSRAGSKSNSFVPGLRGQGIPRSNFAQKENKVCRTDETKKTALAGVRLRETRNARSMK